MKKMKTIQSARVAEMLLQLFAEYDGVHTGSDGMSVEMKTYYEKRLLQEAEPNLVHDQFGAKYPIPKGSGKTIEFRRFLSLPKNLKTLQEGVTPPKQTMEATNILATVDQYGGWIESTDLLELTTIDPILDERTKLLGSQAGRTLDTVTREVINGGTNVVYCPDISGDTPIVKTVRADLTEGCHLAFDPIFRAAAQLKAQNASKFGDCFVGIVHPYSSYDLMSQKEWIDVSKYAHAEQIFNGEIGKVGSVRFVESSEAKVFLPGEIAPGVRRMTVVSGSGTSVVVEGEYETASFAANPIPVYVNGVANTVTALTKGSGTTTLTLGTSATVTKGNMICGQGAAKDGNAVFSTLVIAQNAYAVTELTGGGLQHIVHQVGSAGTADALNQRSSSGWKATKVAKRLNEQYLVRIESVNAYSQIINEN